jgi:hypothetical protein
MSGDLFKDYRDALASARNESLNEIEYSDTMSEDIDMIQSAGLRNHNVAPKVHVDLFLLDTHDLVAKARGVVGGIVTALQEATADSAPHWESGLRTGTLEPVRYKTRQPGDYDVFRSYVDAGEIGSDLAVSVFLDVSGSMGRDIYRLSAAAWATKAACAELTIPCEVMLFNSEGFTLWDADDEVESRIPLLVADGGTDPSTSFAQSLVEKKVKNHLVLVMTDGEWDNPVAIEPYVAPNMTTCALYFGRGLEGDAMDRADKMSIQNGYHITDLFDIPRYLEQMIKVVL